MHRGTCEAMCETWTLETRLTLSEGAKPQINPAQEKIHIFETPDPRLPYNQEFRRLNNGRDPTVYDLVTMRYDRQWSEKSQVANREYEYRTSQALLRTVNYCMKWIIDNDITNVWKHKKVTFMIVNNFIRDRARMVCVEFSSQKDALFGNLAAHQHELEAREKTVRFLIYGTYMLCKDKNDVTTNQNNDEDAAAKQQNGERLTAMLTELGGAYERAQKAGLPVDTARIAEFREYQMYKLGTNLNNSFFATRDRKKVGDYDLLRVQSLESTIPAEVLRQPHFSRCTAVYQCLRNHNYVRFFRILKDAPVIVAAMIYYLYGQHMRITALSLISKLSPKEIPLESITRQLLFNGTQHALKFVQRHMLFLDHTPVQVVAKANGHAIITTKPSKERAKVYRLSDEYPDDIANFIEDRIKRLNLTRTDIVYGKGIGSSMPTDPEPTTLASSAGPAAAHELRQTMQRINSCSSAAKKSALARDELRPRLQAALDAGEPPSSTVVVGAKRLLANLEGIARLLSRTKRLELTKLTKQLESASRSGPQLALCQKLRLCMNRVVDAGVPTTSPEVVAASKLLHEIEQEQARLLKLSKLRACSNVKNLVLRVSRAGRLQQQQALANKYLRPAMRRALECGVPETNTELSAAKKIFDQLELRSRLDKITRAVGAAVDSEPQLFLAKQDLEPQLAEVLAAGVPRESDEVVAAQRLLEMIKAEAALTPRGSKETPRRLEHVEQSTQELEALHRDASHQGIVGIAVIADLFEDAIRALRKLEEHTDARETPSDVFEALQRDFSLRQTKLRTGMSALKSKILSGKETRLRRFKELQSKLSDLFVKSVGTDRPLSSDFKQRLDRLEPLFGAASEIRLPLFAQAKALEHMQLDLDRLLHRAQQHACWRLNAQINKLSAKLNIWRRFKTWRNQTNNPKFCNWVNSIKSSFRASQPRVPAPALPPQPRQPRSANWQPLDLPRLCAAALCRPERFSQWQPFDQQRTLPLKCVLLAPPTNTVEEEDWICRLLSGQNVATQHNAKNLRDAVLSLNKARLHQGNRVVTIVCKRTDTHRLDLALRRKLHGSHVLVMFVPACCLGRGRQQSTKDAKRALANITSRIENALQALGKGAQAVLLLVTRTSADTPTNEDAHGNYLDMDSEEAHRFLVKRLLLQRWLAKAQGTGPATLRKCLLCRLSGKINSYEARRRFADTFKACVAATKANCWLRPVQLSSVIERTLQRLTSYGERKALSIYGWLQLHNGALHRLLQLLKMAIGVIDEWMKDVDGKCFNRQMQAVAARFRNLVLDMPPSEHMGGSAFASASQSLENMTRLHYRILQYLETRVGNAETRLKTDAKRNLNILMVNGIENGEPISAKDIYGIFKNVIHRVAIDNDIIFHVDIRELTAVRATTWTGISDPTHINATALVEACFGAKKQKNWFASLTLQVLKDKYLMFQRTVSAVDGPQTQMFIPGTKTGTGPQMVQVYKERQRAVNAELQHGGQNCAAALVQLCTPKKKATRKFDKSKLPVRTGRTSTRKRKPQWSVVRSSPPRQMEREAAGTPISSQHRRTRTKIDFSDSQNVHAAGENSSASLHQEMAEENRTLLLLEEQWRRDVAEGDDISDLYRHHSTVSEQHVGATASQPCSPAREAASAPGLLNHHVGSTSKSEQSNRDDTLLQYLNEHDGNFFGMESD